MQSDVDLSIIAPAHNEEGNIEGLVADVQQAMAGSGLRFEMILVDDGSTDRTRERLAVAMSRCDWLRGLSLCNTPPGAGNGQSAAFRAGLLEARAPLIALLDADRQNDPADIPRMLEKLASEKVDMVQGDRSANRRDGLVKRIASWVGRSFRRWLLADPIRDTGCSLRVFRREVGLVLPLQYCGVHRFIPYYARLVGFEVIEMSVAHRPRVAGETKYGIRDRALPGLRDLIAVLWMRSRLRDTRATPVEPMQKSRE
jgi:glycosyltransferase involved in cell wall biosynthesis